MVEETITFGLDDHLIFPELSMITSLKLTGMNITIVTNTESDKEALPF